MVFHDNLASLFVCVKDDYSLWSVSGTVLKKNCDNGWRLGMKLGLERIEHCMFSYFVCMVRVSGLFNW